ncbi:MAG: hypothetical protein M5U19_20500 [Microthrixaceae bacterium]|nr:hypothetical protein [Microthrixaceae bacterium]
MAGELRPSVVVDDGGFAALVDRIVEGHRTIAPTLRDSTVMLAEITSVDEIASGVTLEQAPGRCRVVDLAHGDHRRFAWAVGPQSAKGLQHPAERTVFSVEVTAEGFSVTTPGSPAGTARDGSPERPLAVIGLRPCDVAAVGVLDRVLGAGAMGGLDPLVVVVNCAEPGGTCFCVSMDTGPALSADLAHNADLVVWERGAAAGPEYLLVAVSPAAKPWWRPSIRVR